MGGVDSAWRKPAGLECDTLRLEAGLPLHGNELSTISSSEANMKWVVAMDKTNFLGKRQ